MFLFPGSGATKQYVVKAKEKIRLHNRQAQRHRHNHNLSSESPLSATSACTRQSARKGTARSASGHAHSPSSPVHSQTSLARSQSSRAPLQSSPAHSQSSRPRSTSSSARSASSSAHYTNPGPKLAVVTHGKSSTTPESMVAGQAEFAPSQSDVDPTPGLSHSISDPAHSTRDSSHSPPQPPPRRAYSCRAVRSHSSSLSKRRASSVTQSESSANQFQTSNAAHTLPRTSCQSRTEFSSAQTVDPWSARRASIPCTDQNRPLPPLPQPVLAVPPMSRLLPLTSSLFVVSESDDARPPPSAPADHYASISRHSPRQQ